MLVVANMDETLHFYTAVLGFGVVKKFPDYSIVERDGASIHFMTTSDESVVRGHTDIYIEVDDITALWDRVKTLKEKYWIRDLFRQPYGMTEFHIEDPNGSLVFVGQKTV